MILLSPHFTVHEFTRSATAIRKGIDNTPTAEVLENLKLLAESLERVRSILNRPLHITSGYRSPKLNAAIGSKPTSAHVKGLAADFECPSFGTPEAIMKELVKHSKEIGYDKIILEFPPDGWIHLSVPDMTYPKGEALVYRGDSYERYTA